jgi:hypothetical protein
MRVLWVRPVIIATRIAPLMPVAAISMYALASRRGTSTHEPPPHSGSAPSATSRIVAVRSEPPTPVFRRLGVDEHAGAAFALARRLALTRRRRAHPCLVRRLSGAFRREGTSEALPPMPSPTTTAGAALPHSLSKTELRTVPEEPRSTARVAAQTAEQRIGTRLAHVTRRPRWLPRRAALYTACAPRLCTVRRWMRLTRRSGRARSAASSRCGKTPSTPSPRPLPSSAAPPPA